MKKYTRTTNFFIIFIPLLIIFIPFVYASNQTIKLDDSVNNGTTSLSVFSSKVVVSSSVDILQKDEKIDTKFIEIEKARKGVIQNMNDDSSLIVLVKDKLITAKYNATTTVSFGGDANAEIKDLRVGMKVYVFGYLNNEGTTMLVTKIIISSKSPFQRK